MFFLHCPPAPVASSFKDYLPLLGVSVTLSLFIIDRLLAARIRAREVERSWYLKILIEPNIEKINQFFDEIGVEYATSAADLTQKTSQLAHDKYQVEKSLHYEKFIDKKRKLSGQLISPLRPGYSTLAQRLDDSLDEFYDIYTSNLDKSLFSKEDVKSFILKSDEIKATFLSILYSPLER